MGRFSLRFELLDEVVISGRTDSVGGQTGLDYLPGANLLGAVAAALYPVLPREDAWTLFHSGKVRFGNALPTTGGEPGWPLPLCWHGETATPDWHEHGKLRADKVHNLIHSPVETLRRDILGNAAGFRPLPAGYVALTGQYLKPQVLFRMKSGVSPQAGRAGDERVFGYASLAAGQSFLADIAYDEDVPSDLLERLREFFAARPTLIFGRSRSAQYGRVACEAVPSNLAFPPGAWPRGLEVSLWLLSDLAACDRHGFPTLTPEAEDLGFPSADPVPAQSFVQHRAYSPYNGFHQLHGTERQVIGQGSVLTYRLREPMDEAAWAALAARVARGLGLYREAGLGRCVLGAALLATRHPDFTAASPAPSPIEAPPPPVPDHPLARWLLDAAESRSVLGGMRLWANLALGELEQLERSARRLNGLREDQPASPGRPLWGRVAEAARRASTAAHGDGHRRLREELFGDTHAVCRIHHEDWNRPTAGADGQALTYREWLEKKMTERPEDAPSAIGLLAELAQRRLAKR